jgi:aldehyde:ferredoxin oxidoreductase
MVMLKMKRPLNALSGYAGKILRIDLTNKSTDTLKTEEYLPKYVGGRALCNKIFWDEVQPGVAAFDPDNKIIFMSGPTSGTGIPTGGRSVFTGISPNSFPEQYSWSGIGGWFGAELKFAGYDGMIIEGRSDEPCYVYIEDEDVKFLSAESIWGRLVHPTQEWLRDAHGEDVQSVVIGPAGENLMRNASITTSSDNVAAKSGFGAVWGSKNLKAITVKGNGAVYPADIDGIYKLRKTMSKPQFGPNPVVHETTWGAYDNNFEVPGGWDHGWLACSHGCNQKCNRLMMGVKSAFSEERANRVEKCVGFFNAAYTYDFDSMSLMNYETEKNGFAISMAQSYTGFSLDPSDPYFAELVEPYKGDRLDYWGPDFDRGSVLMDLCNEYGIDKWDVLIWYMTWLSAAKKEGLLEDIDFGMEVDVESEEFIRYFMDMITYRKGKYGPIFAEGMARALRILGKEKYGDAIYHGRYSRILERQLDLPVSLETAWGHSVHWQGRGFEATIRKPGWLVSTLTLMTSTRDAQTVSHVHDLYENYLQYKDDPCHSKRLVENAVFGENRAEIKDTVLCCEWQSPDLHWKTMEAEMYTAATGVPMSEDDLNELAERSKLLFRAILMRNFGRDRSMEVEATFPMLTYPDPWGETCTWKEWNDCVDLYYDERGWDQKTGWPFRATWEKYGLSDIADEMESLGKLPG